MKKLLIVNNNMHIGGVQKSLLNLLGEIHKDYDHSPAFLYGRRAFRTDPRRYKDCCAFTPFSLFGHDKA